MALCIDIRCVFLKIFHAIALIQYLIGILYDIRSNTDPKLIDKIEFFKPRFGGITRYLTYWGLVS